MQSRAEERIMKLKSTVPSLPEPDPTGKSYQLFIPRTDALKHLEQHWKTWLRYYSPELGRDYLFQDQLQKLDAQLLAALRNRMKNDFSTGKSSAKIADIVPPRRARTDAEIAELPASVRKKLARLGAAAVSRNL